MAVGDFSVSACLSYPRIKLLSQEHVFSKYLSAEDKLHIDGLSLKSVIKIDLKRILLS